MSGRPEVSRVRGRVIREEAGGCGVGGGLVCVRERGQMVWSLLRGLLGWTELAAVINICDRGDSSPLWPQTQRQLRSVTALQQQTPHHYLWLGGGGCGGNTADTPSDLSHTFYFQGKSSLARQTHQMCL